MARFLRDNLTSTLAGKARQGIVETIRSSPAATLEDLADLLKSEWGAVARTITVAELVGHVASTPAADEDGEVNTRTPDGRSQFDGKVLQVLRAAKTPMTATEVRRRVGGTPLQTRTALNRLIASGLVRWTGQARGTQYRSA